MLPPAAEGRGSAAQKLDRAPHHVAGVLDHVHVRFVAPGRLAHVGNLDDRRYVGQLHIPLGVRRRMRRIMGQPERRHVATDLTHLNQKNTRPTSIPYCAYRMPSSISTKNRTISKNPY